jgi:hypothetical protein
MINSNTIKRKVWVIKIKEIYPEKNKIKIWYSYQKTRKAARKMCLILKFKFDENDTTEVKTQIIPCYLIPLIPEKNL